MSRDGFLKRANSNNNSASHKRAPKQEKKWAKKGGGRLTPGSGNKAIKGDVQKFNGIVRIECKTTKHASYSVSLKLLDKLENSALPHGEVPAIVVEFTDGVGLPKGEIAVVPTWILDLLRDIDDE